MIYPCLNQLFVPDATSVHVFVFTATSLQVLSVTTTFAQVLVKLFAMTLAVQVIAPNAE
jgi:hypothetical protein